jgi:hypothetical protein
LEGEIEGGANFKGREVGVEEKREYEREEGEGDTRVIDRRVSA